MTINHLDYSIIAVYLLLMVAVGFVLRKAASGSLEDYYIGGRKLPWWALGMSGMASFVDITGTSLITAFLFMMGPKGLYIEFRGGAALILVFMMLWLGKWHRRSGCITGAEWMRYRFGEDWQGHAASLIMAVSFILTTTVLLAYLSKGVGIFVSTFLPFTPLQCSIGMFMIAGIYTLFSGFYGVVVTDVIQTVIICFAVFFVSFVAMKKIAVLGPNFHAMATNVTGNTDWDSITPGWQVSFQKGYEEYNLFIVGIAFFIVKAIQQGLGEGWDPKYFGARNDRECGLLTFLWMWFFMLRWPLMMAFAALGIIIVSTVYPDKGAILTAANHIHGYFPDITINQWPQVLSKVAASPDQYSQLVGQLSGTLGQDWQSKILMLGYNPGTINPERIMAESIRQCINPGMRGLILVSMLAASMSSFDSAVNKAAGFFVRDIYQKYIRPTSSNRELIYASYGFIIMIVAGSLFMGYSAKNINDIWSWLMMGLGAGLSMPLILRLYWWRFNGCGFLCGAFTGLLSAILQRVYFSDMNVFVSFVVLTMISCVATVVGTYIAKPPAEEELKHFYVTTRPFGLWGRYKQYLPHDELKKTEKENRRDLLAIPFAMIWYVTLLLLPMQIVLLKFDVEFWVTVLIFIISFVFFYKIWLRYQIFEKLAG